MEIEPRPFRPLERRARVAITSFWVFIGASALFAVSLIACISVGANIYSDVPYAVEETPAGGVALLSLAVTAIAFFVTFIICSVVFLMWLFRARKNLPALGISAVRWSPGWSMAWWFIPIMSLFRPYQVVKETWQVTDPTSAPGEQRSQKLPSYFVWWWTLYLIYTIGINVTDNYASAVGGDPDLDEAAVLTMIDVIMLLVGMGAAWNATRIMRDITARQTQRHQVDAFA